MLMHSSRRASGFTMIEMAVTMMIFAILVAVGVPVMGTWVKNNKVRAVSDAWRRPNPCAAAVKLCLH
jgi:prepilin-type N-terminal cleavage/methylation domain-containing protein